jgi:sporulation protein YlmC with PRC-barrel domain
MSLADRHAKGNYTVAVRKSMIGSRVINAARENLGKIEDIVIDMRDDQIAYAILSFGGILGVGDKHFAIPWDAMTYSPADQCVILNLEKSRLENAPGFDKHNWPDMADSAWANQVRSHYGYPPQEHRKAAG